VIFLRILDILKLLHREILEKRGKETPLLLKVLLNFYAYICIIIRNIGLKFNSVYIPVRRIRYESWSTRCHRICWARVGKVIV